MGWAERAEQKHRRKRGQEQGTMGSMTCFLGWGMGDGIGPAPLGVGNVAVAVARGVGVVGLGAKVSNMRYQYIGIKLIC